MATAFTLDVEVENGAGITSLLTGLSRQLPYAISLSINDTLNVAQRTIQDRLPQTFTLRRPEFVANTIYIGPKDRATKANLVGRVRVHPERDVLAKFEEGGQKVPRAGRSLAVPVFRMDDPRRIIRAGDPLHVRRLMQVIQNVANRRNLAGAARRMKRRVRRTLRRFNAANASQFVYLVRSPKGVFIVQRYGPNKRDTRVLYAFRRAVPIPASLRFIDTAYEAAVKSWPQNADHALAVAIATARIP